MECNVFIHIPRQADEVLTDDVFQGVGYQVEQRLVVDAPDVIGTLRLIGQGVQGKALNLAGLQDRQISGVEVFLSDARRPQRAGGDGET